MLLMHPQALTIFSYVKDSCKLYKYCVFNGRLFRFMYENRCLPIYPYGQRTKLTNIVIEASAKPLQLKINK